MSRWIDIDDYRNCYIGNDGEYERWNIDPNVLDEAKPIVKSERKKGRWVAYIGRDLGIEGQWMRDDGKTVFVQCDQCGELYVRNFMANWNYCPNCGAEMRGEEG